MATTGAPNFDSTACFDSLRVMPTTSCPAAISRGMRQAATLMGRVDTRAHLGGGETSSAARLVWQRFLPDTGAALSKMT